MDQWRDTKGRFVKGHPYFGPTKPIDKETLVKLYTEKGLSQRQIAKVLGCSQLKVQIYMRRYDISSRPTGGMIEPNLTPSPTLSYILGVLLGDGSVFCTKRSNGYFEHYVALGATAKEFVLSFKKAIERAGLHPRIYVHNPPKRKKLYEARAVSKRFFGWYKDLKPHDIEKIVSTDRACKIAFIKGFYESEGCLSRAKRKQCKHLTMINTNKELLILVQRVLNSIGYSANVNGPYGNIYHLRLLGGTAQVERFLEEIKPCIKKEISPKVILRP